MAREAHFVREAMLRIVKRLLIVVGTLHFALCKTQCFTAASPLLHLPERANFTKCCNVLLPMAAMELILEPDKKV